MLQNYLGGGGGGEGENRDKEVADLTPGGRLSKSNSPRTLHFRHVSHGTNRLGLWLLGRELFTQVTPLQIKDSTSATTQHLFL